MHVINVSGNALRPAGSATLQCHRCRLRCLLPFHPHPSPCHHEIHHHRPPFVLASAATATLTITEPSCAHWCKSLANHFQHFDCAQSISIFYCCGSQIRVLSVAGPSPIIIVYFPGQPLGPMWTDDRCHRVHPEFEYPCPG